MGRNGKNMPSSFLNILSKCLCLKSIEYFNKFWEDHSFKCYKILSLHCLNFETRNYFFLDSNRNYEKHSWVNVLVCLLKETNIYINLQLVCYFFIICLRYKPSDTFDCHYGNISRRIQIPAKHLGWSILQN